MAIAEAAERPVMSATAMPHLRAVISLIRVIPVAPDGAFRMTH